MPPKEERPKPVLTPPAALPVKEDRPRDERPRDDRPKDDRRKNVPNPLVPLHEVIVAAKPTEVWNKVADSLDGLLQDWQSFARNQQWDRLVSNLAAATTIAAGMSLLWERSQKYYQGDAEPDVR